MREIWSEIESWRQSGKSIALATVIQVEGSSLRPTASKMAVTSAGDIAGSVTGGCVEGAVFEEAQTVIQTGQSKCLHYGIGDSTAWSVGLACGGSIQVFVESLADPSWQNVESGIRQCIEKGQLAALATLVAGDRSGKKLLIWPDGRHAGDLGSPALNAQVKSAAMQCWKTHSAILMPSKYEQGDCEVFIEVLAPMPRLIIIGAVHIAIPLITIAKALNFHTIVIDARSAFANRSRFPHVDEMIVEWPATALEKLCPDTGTSVVCLSHDEKLDNPSLQVALASQARYVGALGSRKTHARRLEALREMGTAEESLARIHAPIGLKLGARYPEEIALAIMSEIVAVSHGIEV